MFSQNGYAGTNLRELTRFLGMGKSSVYRCFESMEEINELMAKVEALGRYFLKTYGPNQNAPEDEAQE